MIRRRIVVTALAVVFVVLGITGIATVVVIQNRLMEQVEDELVSRADRVDAARRRGPRSLIELFRAPGSGFGVDRTTAVAVIGGDGTWEMLERPGTRDEPLAGPDIDDIAGQPLDARIGWHTVGGDNARYRMLGLQITPAGDVVLIGESLARVDDAVAQARRIFFVLGAGALVVVGSALWFDTRRRLQPLEHMASTAARITAGDLSARTDEVDDDSEVGTLATAMNTMLDRIEEAVDQKTTSEERMRRFVADASHELRTPLTSVRGYAELYRQGADDPESVRRGMERIEHEATRMTTLVEDLLLLARLDQRRAVSPAPVDVRDLSRRAVEAARAVEPERTITFDADDTPVMVHGDAGRLRQILDNLLANVRAHTDAEVDAAVQVRTHGAHAQIVVSDRGPGIPAEALPRVFDRFWQADADQDVAGGAGLGLAIVHALVVAHQGTVSVDSTVDGPDTGTTFTIELPLGGTSP